MNVMEDRTVNIIMISKRYYWTEEFDGIAKYMSRECGVKKDTYTTEMIEGIIKNAFLDYIRCAHTSRVIALINNFLDPLFKDKGDGHRMMHAFGLAQIAEHSNTDDTWYYIDGFHHTEYMDVLEVERTLDGHTGRYRKSTSYERKKKKAQLDKE